MISARDRGLEKGLTAVRVLGNIPRLGIDDGLHEQSQILIMGQ